MNAPLHPIKSSPRKAEPIIPSGILGISMFILTEIMLFAALISAYLVIRSGINTWPPLGQPRLPISTTAFNTLILILSGIALIQASRYFTSKPVTAKKLCGLSFFLGSFFVIFQGYEWIQLISFGLTLTSSVYGGVFYLIIGIHAIHAIGGLATLGWAYRKFGSTEEPLTKTEFNVVQIFWYFVVGLWPLLYSLIYLS